MAVPYKINTNLRFLQPSSLIENPSGTICISGINLVLNDSNLISGIPISEIGTSGLDPCFVSSSIVGALNELIDDIKTVSGIVPTSSGVDLLNGLSGIIEIITENDGIDISVSGQNIILTPLFTGTSGALLEQKCEDVITLSGLIPQSGLATVAVTFTPESGTLFVLEHGLGNECFNWDMWRTDADPIISVIPDYVSPSGADHIIVSLKAPMSGLICLTAGASINTGSDFDPDNLLWVAKNGNDITGDGSYHNPYLTIKKATDVVDTLGSETNRFSIVVAPGVYVEDNPISLPSYTNIRGVSCTLQIKVQASNIDQPIFDNELSTGAFSTSGSLQSMTIAGASGHAGLLLTNADAFSLLDARFVDCSGGILLSSGSNVFIQDCFFVDNIADIESLDTISSYQVGGITRISRDKLIVPSGFDYNSSLALFHDEKVGDESVVIHGELAVGRPEQGSESIFGEGDSYTRGMVIITTDDTTGSIGDGGNFIDVSDIASENDGNTFSFQGSGIGHSILIGSELINENGTLKFWGIKSAQTSGSVSAPTSHTPEYIAEVWTGALWFPIGVMATESNNFYRYSNTLFQRENSSEHIRFGLDDEGGPPSVDSWERKTINGKNLYWVRFVVNGLVDQLPAFDQFKLSSSRSEANPNGTVTYHGLSRFKRTILAVGNIFGESGGVINATPTVGSGTSPINEWTHQMVNNEFNNNGDAVYMQFILPRGIDTSFPLDIRVVYSVNQAGASSDGTMIVSTLPLEVEGNTIADPDGGKLPVARTIGNTETLVDKSGDSETVAIPLDINNKIRSFTTQTGKIDSYYEGDVLALRLEYDDDGSGNKDITLWGIEVAGVFWTNGEII